MQEVVNDMDGGQTQVCCRSLCQESQVKEGGGRIFTMAFRGAQRQVYDTTAP